MSHHCKCVTNAECIKTLCHGAYSGKLHPDFSLEENAKHGRIDLNGKWRPEDKPTKE